MHESSILPGKPVKPKKEKGPSHKAVRRSVSWNAEVGTLSIVWRDNVTSVYSLGELPQDMVNSLMYWGLIARIQQSYVSSKGSPEVAREKAGKLWEQFKKNDWGLSRGEKSPSITVLALAQLLSTTPENAQERWLALPLEMRQKISHRPDVLSKIAELKALKTEGKPSSLAAIL